MNVNNIETLSSSDGLRVTIASLGAAIRSIVLPTPQGPRDVVVAYDDPGRYLTDPFYIGSTVGPYANRIGNARFEIDGTTFNLDANDGDRGNCLHGGPDGLHRQPFAMHREANGRSVRCTADLADGVGGFPGNRSFEVVYTLLDDWSLAIDYRVTTDKATVVSLANHAYFNLGGPIDSHRIRIYANRYTPVDKRMLPTGQQLDVADSKFDLRELQPLGARQLDQNFVLEPRGEKPQLAAQLYAEESGLQLNVLTTQTALQVYTGDYLDQPFGPRQGICLEAQAFPDAPNRPEFPSTQLQADATYRQRTVYQFVR